MRTTVLLDVLNSAYDILHLWGYYDGITRSSVVIMGFKEAKTIIDNLKTA
ncbi:MAG: DUF5618 family protein [Bacteroidales bacterium]|jgi:hypothetical protein|nr:DUF5618 family protein [Bacteroidales bacterium]